jgi:hypothetical protein
MNIKKSLSIFVLTLALAALVFFLGNQILYPTYVCDGELNKYIEWTKDYDNKPSKVLEDTKTKVAWSIRFKRGAMLINDDRFPFYKELNQQDNFAKKTPSGYEGGYSVNFIQKYKYQFHFNEISKQLSVTVQAEGPHIIEAGVGRDKGKFEFLGSCEQRWF